MFEGIQKTAGTYLKHCKDIPYIYKGMSNVEGVYLWHMIDKLKPNVIFESGIGHGRSTEVLLKAKKQYGVKRYISVDIEKERVKWAEARGVESYCGDAHKIYHKILRRKKRVFCCVDGPKGGHSMVKLLNSMERSKCIGMFTHDAVRGSKVYKTIKRNTKKMSCDLVMPDINKEIRYVNDEYIKEYASRHPNKSVAEHLKRCEAILILIWKERINGYI